jgi:flagellar L-ring protein precursor FlgH
MGGMLGGLKLDGGTIGSAGGGIESKGAQLRGAVSVHVLEVLPNGNLVVRGEKQLSLSDGAEAIQVAGIIRPTDVSYNNTVQSGRLANAQFNYKGSGDLANSSKPGWGTRALMKVWPF